MKIKNVKFETSVFDRQKILNTDKKQVVLVGKSNVGKSSFINAITNNSKLAKVGNTPGKTKSINYYNVNDEFYIVDLPGYGFSKMSKIEKNNIANLIDSYFKKSNIASIIFILDIRHKPTEDDRQMYDYLTFLNIPSLLIANKSDKISKTKIEENIKIIEKNLFSKDTVIPFSSVNKTNLEYIISYIEEKI